MFPSLISRTRFLWGMMPGLPFEVWFSHGENPVYIDCKRKCYKLGMYISVLHYTDSDKPAGIAFPCAINNCFPCHLRCWEEQLQKLFLYSAKKVVFFFSSYAASVWLLFELVVSVYCHAAYMIRKYPCRKWKCTYQTKNSKCFSIHLCRWKWA